MGHYQNFRTVVFCTAQSMEKISREALQKQIDFFQTYVGVDKVYLELYRDDTLISEEQCAMCKETFEQNGILVSGALTTTVANLTGEDAKRQRLAGTYCFSNEPMRKHLKNVVQYIAAKFDEFIIDDFYFTACRCEDCIKAKGGRSWEEFHCDVMEDVSRELVIGPAKEVNPNINIIIKYPNWRESFQESGYCPDTQKDMFDWVYTGTETRHAIYGDQHLPRYESYSLMRFMENTKPGRNGGGWFDPYGCYPIDIYLEQAYLTAFSKPQELMLFCWGSLYKNKLVTPFRFQLSRIDTMMSETGGCKGVPVYLPHRSQGEDHLEDYLGMAGIPFEPTPDFPETAERIFLTKAAHTDPDVIAKLERFVREGGTAIVSSGFLTEGLDKGLRQMTSVRYNGLTIAAKQYSVSKTGAGFGFSSYITPATPVAFPLLEYRTNASWQLIGAVDREYNAPVMIRDTYGKGQLICLAVPDSPSEIKNLPREALTRIRYEFTPALYLEAEADHSLFLYDNDVFALYSYITPDCGAGSVRIHCQSDAEELVPLDTTAVSIFAPSKFLPVQQTETESVFEVHGMPGEFAFFRVVRGERKAAQDQAFKPFSAPHFFVED